MPGADSLNFAANLSNLQLNTLLYPLLVHVRLFGGGYRSQVARIVSRFT